MFKVPTKEIAEVRRKGKIRQANALLRSKQPLDLMQKRLFYIILETVRTTDTQLSDVEFPISQLKELLSGTYGSFVADLFNASQGLVGTSFSILKPTGSWVTTPIFDRIEYLKAGDTNNRGYKNNSGEDVVRAKLHDDLEAYLLRLERNYNTQDLIHVLTIPRVRSHRLFEILLHESWRGERPEFEMAVEELQAFLGIDETYKRWQDFKRTLSRQRTIVHDFTNLRFDFEGRRTGRSVTHVRFHVSFVEKSVQGTLEINDPHRTIEEIQLANELKDAGYSQDPFLAIREHGVKRVRKTLKQAKAAQKASQGSKGQIHNLGGFIHYQLQQEELPEGSLEKETLAIDLNVIVNSFVEVYEKGRDEIIAQQLSQYTRAERQELLDRATSLMNSFERKLFATGDERMYRPTLNRYLLDHDLVEVPKKFKSLKAYYATKEFGYDTLTNENIYSLM